MHTWVQVIDPDGRVTFSDLGPAGVTLIGRHPSNRIVLSDPDVAPVHAVFDHRQKPYSIRSLRNTQVTLGGRRLTAHAATPWGPGEQVHIGHYTLVLLRDQPVAPHRT